MTTHQNKLTSSNNKQYYVLKYSYYCFYATLISAAPGTCKQVMKKPPKAGYPAMLFVMQASRFKPNFAG